MRRIERLINLVAALLEAPRPMTAERIRESIAGYEQDSFEAFRRAFERDKQDLRAMGVPIEAVPTDAFSEHADGYVIPKGDYYLPDLDLEQDELAALKMAADAVLGSGRDAAAGFMKLAADAPSLSWTGPRVVMGADVSAEQPLLATIHTALLEHHPIDFTYRAHAGEETKRRVETYSLVHRRGNWYIVGRDVGKDALRSFKVSRISSAVTTSAGNYQIPRGFDPNEHLSREAWEMGDEVERIAVLSFHPPVRWWAEQNMPGIKKEAAEGTLEVETPLGNIDALVAWVIGFAGGVEVVSPPEARERMRAHLSGLLTETV